MKSKYWTIIGGLYAGFTILVAMVAVEEGLKITADKPQDVARAVGENVLCGERLHQSDTNPRRDLFLTIWSTRWCASCEKMEAEIPALEAAGYNVVLRKVPAPRWVQSFPTIVVNKGSLNGERVTVIAGFKTTEEIDEILQIREATEEEVEDPDYNIFSPRTQVHDLNLVVWLHPDCDVCDRQYEEIAKLRKLGFSANVYMLGGPTAPPEHINSFPTVVLIYNRGPRGFVLGIWREFVTADQILVHLG